MHMHLTTICYSEYCSTENEKFLIWILDTYVIESQPRHKNAILSILKSDLQQNKLFTK